MKPFTFFLAGLLLLSLSGNSQAKYSKSKSKNDSEEKSIEIIRKIFKDFIQYYDGIDSHVNKEAVKKALKSLPDTINKNDLPLLINVWMYYDATDFPTRELIMPIFIKNKKISLVAMKLGIKRFRTIFGIDRVRKRFRTNWGQVI